MGSYGEFLSTNDIQTGKVYIESILFRELIALVDTNAQPAPSPGDAPSDLAPSLVDPPTPTEQPAPSPGPSDLAPSFVDPPTEQPAPSPGPSDLAPSLVDPPTEQPAPSPGNAPSDLAPPYVDAPPDVDAFCGIRLLELGEKVSLF